MNTTSNRWMLAAAVAALSVVGWSLSGRTAAEAQQPEEMPAVVPIPSPAIANAGEPQLTVSSRGVLLSWVEHAGSKATLRFAERTPTGWTVPRTVASGDDWTVNGIDVPSVQRLANGSLVASWLRKAVGGMHANSVQLSYSSNDGRTWMPSFTAHNDKRPGERLFASLFQWLDGGFGLVWLDGGAKGPATAAGSAVPQHPAQGGDHGRGHEGGHQGHEGHQGRAGHTAPGGMGGMANMTLRSAIFSGALKQTAELPVDPRVCECCSTATAVTSEGVLVAYRNRSDDEIRDIYVARLQEGRWSEPVPVYADNWRIPGCPVNGPALSARGRDVAVAWYTVKQEQGRAYLAVSGDAGKSFGKPIRLDDGGSLGQVDVEMLPDGSAIATWIELVDGRSQFRARRIGQRLRSAPLTIAAATAGRTGGGLRTAHHGDELLFAWTDVTNGTRHVRLAAARLPSTAR